jgi:hypothetical protein
MSFENITKTNFVDSFDVSFIHGNKSVFYPASGLDTSSVSYLFPEFDSFVHVDYSHSESQVSNFMETAFIPLGFKLIGMRHITERMLTPSGFHPMPFTPNRHEISRLQDRHIRDRFYGVGFKPFARWALYEKETSPLEMKTESRRFSLLHLGAEAMATFEALYLGYRKNPRAICIIKPSEGYGDNWTIFRDPEFRFHKMIVQNYSNNQSPMPKVLLTDTTEGPNHTCFWPGYQNPPEICDDMREIFKYRRD